MSKSTEMVILEEEGITLGTSLSPSPKKSDVDIESQGLFKSKDRSTAIDVISGDAYSNVSKRKIHKLFVVRSSMLMSLNLRKIQAYKLRSSVGIFPFNS